jgi:hypothetical protein
LRGLFFCGSGVGLLRKDDRDLSGAIDLDPPHG